MDILIEKELNRARGGLPYMSWGVTKFMYVNHCHSEAELMRCEEGSFKITTSTGVISLTKGDIALFMPNQIHGVEVPDGSRASFIKFFPTPAEDYNSFASLVFPEVVINNETVRDDISMLLDKMKKEDVERGAFYRSAISSLMQEILVKLMRKLPHSFMDKDSQEKANRYGELVRDIDSYLGLHFREDVTLNDLATYLNLSKYYLCRIFAEATGMGYVEYVTRYRLIKSISMMDDQSKSLSDISMDSGFADVKTYIRSFKKYYDTTPGIYRRGLRRDK